jgi:hypothetical protein
LNEGGWGVYPPFLIQGRFFLFLDGEDASPPTPVEYYLN